MKLFLRMYKSRSANLWFYHMSRSNRHGVCSNWYEVGWWMTRFPGAAGREPPWGRRWECPPGRWRTSAPRSTWRTSPWRTGRSARHPWCLSMDLGTPLPKAFRIPANSSSSALALLSCSPWSIAALRSLKRPPWRVSSSPSPRSPIPCPGEPQDFKNHKTIWENSSSGSSECR